MVSVEAVSKSRGLFGAREVTELGDKILSGPVVRCIGISSIRMVMRSRDTCIRLTDLLRKLFSYSTAIRRDSRLSTISIRLFRMTSIVFAYTLAIVTPATMKESVKMK